ncbi:MAG: TetR/AcrR family transcriptional regulator C-terminal domain-containing protein [Butyribacter sp.]|nr:TetR/AcrR family transcriptional regulator C-terminal domain-containing protein [bacterium]MDY3853526.1 TetR/AcrR family transcriptional regulator C-terminal domain-containing protein [Butyribacter sp.]
MEINGKKVDRRTVKTKKAIRKAFLKLIEEKDINEITIQNIADEADINRKTFYNYYNGIYQVLEEIENEILETFQQDLQTLNVQNYNELVCATFRKLADIFQSDVNLHRLFMQMGKNSVIMERLKKIILSHSEQFLSEFFQKNENAAELAREYCLSGVIAVFAQWLKSGQKIPVEELAHAVTLMSAGVIQSLSAQDLSLDTIASSNLLSKTQ